MKLINKHKKELEVLCEKFHVKELYVFGSMVKNNFSKISDIDFLVLFKGVNPLDYFDNYIDFKSDLETLYSRDVDLLEVQTLKNPILKRSIEKNKVKVYG